MKYNRTNKSDRMKAVCHNPAHWGNTHIFDLHARTPLRADGRQRWVLSIPLSTPLNREGLPTKRALRKLLTQKPAYVIT